MKNFNPNLAAGSPAPGNPVSGRRWNWIGATLTGVAAVTLLTGCDAMVHLTASALAAEVDGPDEWQADKAEYDAEQKAVAAEIETLGLDKRYKTVYLDDNTRYNLYTCKCFDLVEESLSKQLAGCTTPLASYRYYLHTDTLGNFYYDDPAKLLAVLDDWVTQKPQSHFARLIRGKFLKEYAWYFRGGGYSDEVTGNGWTQFETYLRRAKDDLEAAYAMDPKDPESPAALIGVAAGLGLGEEAAQAYYDQAIAACPSHYGARYERMDYSQPRWGGSWKAMDANMKECETASAAFPLLLLINEFALGQMDERSPKYEALAASLKTKEKWLKACIAQAEQSPGDLHVLGEVAFYATGAENYKTATEYFKKVGDQFPTGCSFADLADYNKWRAISYAARSDDSDVVGSEQETALITEAIALAPNNAFVNLVYAEHFISRKEYDAARTPLEKALALDPDFSAPTLTMGWLNYHQGRYDEAIRFARQYLATVPSQATKDEAQEIIELSTKKKAAL